jgi:hypothetical protein
MAKRKKTDIVQVKLRIREALRKRLETAARGAELSLNSEITRRLENSFQQDNSSTLINALIRPGIDADLLRSVVAIVGNVGPRWYKDAALSHAVASAINKVIAVFMGEIPPSQDAFPEWREAMTADYLAWTAVETLLKRRQRLVSAFGAAGDTALGWSPISESPANLEWSGSGKKGDQS